jgi:hypothetical protein
LIINTGGAATGLIIEKGNTIVKAGNLGVGTDNPTKKLDVAGDINTSGDILALNDVCIGSGICLSDVADLINSQKTAGGVHTRAQCTAAGGTLIDISAAAPLCRFNSSNCPNGWAQLYNWSTTARSTCSTPGCSWESTPTCSTSYHAWGNISREVCMYARSEGGAFYQCICSACQPCYASFTQIGCY